MKNLENKTILDYETVDFNKEENCLVIIDQTLLPGKTEIIELKTAQEIWDAIYLLKVRGAPAIGVAAAFGIYQLSFEIWKNRKDVTCEEFEKQFLEQKEFLNSSRPTAVNPFLGIEPYGEGSPEGAGRRKECRTDRNASWRRSLPDEGRGYCCLQGYWGEWSFSCETGGWNPHTLQCGTAGNL